MKIIMLVGLPGSGKTHLGKSMEDDNTIFLDDITIVGGIDELKQTLIYGWENIIISDVFLCRSIDREKAKKWLERNAPDYPIEWIYFENTPDKCHNNVLRRNADGDGRQVGELIKQLTKVYTIPEFVEVYKVFSD